MKAFARIVPLTAALLLAACGDEVTQINQTGLEVYSAEKDLPECTGKNEGEQAFVKKDAAARICVDGEWVPMAPDAANGDFSCKTEELKDGSGLKIVCNGDSIGVVLNGSDGKDGKAGKDGSDGEDGKAGTGCAMTDKTDSTVTVKCGDSTMVIELGVGASADTAEADSERVPISLDSIVGLTQKGPFLKGSTVYLYELSDGRTLKQTNGNFTSNISQDNGRYKFLARDLVSQYAMIIVDGYYRNEVTGVSSNAPIRLKAITDMRKRNSVNVNILTHLEFERVYYLVTKGDSTGKKLTVKQAKRQAQKEILKIFDIELDDNTDAEDMDVFGSDDADAALLAISVLLQGERSEGEMIALLSEISEDVAEDGEWNDTAARVAIADWAFGQNLLKLRNNVEGWHLNGDNKVGDFEKYINNYIAVNLKIDTCATESENLQVVDNPLSRFNGRTYQCYKGTGIDSLPYLTWADKRENPYLNLDTRIQTGEYELMMDWRDRRLYHVIRFLFYVPDPENSGHDLYFSNAKWMAENLDFEYWVDGKVYNSKCANDECNTEKPYGRYYNWAAAMDSAGVFSKDGVGCGDKKLCSASGKVRGICPEGWFLPTKEQFEYLLQALEIKHGAGTSGLVLRAKSGWNVGGKDYNGTDLYGLSILPAGRINAWNNPTFVGEQAELWTSTEIGKYSAAFLEISYDEKNAAVTDHNKGGADARSIRCLKE